MQHRVFEIFKKSIRCTDVINPTALHVDMYNITHDLSHKSVVRKIMIGMAIQHHTPQLFTCFFYKHKVYKHNEAQISKNLSIS